METLKNLDNYSILLASKSPRRKELLEMIRIPFNCVSKEGIDENYPEEMPKEEVPQYLSNKKADAFLPAIKDDELIITADTLVLGYGGNNATPLKGNDPELKVFGKPKDISDAKKMIKELSGKVHMVVTGVTIATKRRRKSFTVKTEVKFGELTDQEIDYYVNNFHPIDKAGAYGIQEWIGGVAVEWIKGSYFNVMGLPVHRLYQELKEF